MKSKLLVLFVLAYVSFGCGVNSKTGMSNNPSPEVQSSSIVDLIEDDEIVIEGTVLFSSSYFVDRMIYTSNVVEVNTIFKGVLTDKVVEIYTKGGRVGGIGFNISHGIYLAPEKSLAIFSFRKVKGYSIENELRKHTPFPVFILTKSAILVQSNGGFENRDLNIELDIYQKLELELGVKRKLVLGPAATNELAISYSAKNNLIVPNRSKGVIYKWTAGKDKRRDYIAVNVLMSSAGAITSLNHGELIVSYNSEIFGDSVVSNGLVKNRPLKNYKSENSARFGGIPQAFEVNCKDVSSNSFKIEWVNTGDIKNGIQLLSKSHWIVGTRLFFKVENNLGRTGFQFSSIDSLNTRYDHSMKENVPYSYVATPEIMNVPIEAFQSPVIKYIIPKSPCHVLDTVRVFGLNFQEYPIVSIYTKNASGYYRYKEIPERNIIHKSDTLISFIIPQRAKSKDNYDWVPVTGKVVIKQGYKELEQEVWSGSELKIQDDK